MAAYGFVFRTYRTFPVRTEHGIGIGQELISEEWLPTMRACQDEANIRAWRMNGGRVPSSSFGWGGNGRTHSSDPDAPNFDPTAEWFYCFSTRGQELFHGHRFGWIANVSQHDVPIGPLCAHETPIGIPCSPCEDCKPRVISGLTHVGTAYYVPDDVFVDVHTTDSKSRTQITHPYKGTIIVPSLYLRSFVPGTLHAN